MRLAIDFDNSVFSFEGTYPTNPVVIARRSHPFPYRTRKLSSLASKILGGQLPGKIERCRNKLTDEVNMLRPLCIFFKKQNILLNEYSSIAQSVERMTVNHDVAGSSPAGGARKNDLFDKSFFQ